MRYAPLQGSEQGPRTKESIQPSPTWSSVYTTNCTLIIQEPDYWTQTPLLATHKCDKINNVVK